MRKNICNPKTLSNEKRFSVSGLLPYFILTALAIIILILEPNLFNYKWLGLKTDTTFVLMLVSIGQTIVLLQGGIDLSVGGVICVTNSIACLYMPESPGGIILVALGLLGLGLVMGFINGLIIDRTRLQPFIVTLATWSIWSGIALSILPVDGGRAVAGFQNFLIATPGGISVSFIMMILLIVWWQYFKRTSLGISIYAVGSNEKAAFFNGINVNKVRILAYGISGLFAAGAGLFRTAQVASGSPTAGNNFIMTSIAVAVIGGTSLSGGKGGIGGTIAGAFIYMLISDLLIFSGASTYWSALFQGGLLISAVAISSISTMLKRRNVQL